jgi:hypothetical protein
MLRAGSGERGTHEKRKAEIEHQKSEVSDKSKEQGAGSTERMNKQKSEC